MDGQTTQLTTDCMYSGDAQHSTTQQQQQTTRIANSQLLQFMNCEKGHETEKEKKYTQIIAMGNAESSENGPVSGPGTDRHTLRRKEGTTNI